MQIKGVEETGREVRSGGTMDESLMSSWRAGREPRAGGAPGAEHVLELVIRNASSKRFLLAGVLVVEHEYFMESTI